MGFSGALIEGVRFIDCTFRGVRSTEVLQQAGLISFDHVTIEPSTKDRSLNTRPDAP
jgi:hypothetical protein